LVSFLYTKLDFIFFVYSILILLVSKYSFINSKLEKENNLWHFLMLFSLFYGLRMIADTVSLGGYHIYVISNILSAFAFLSLMEYARINTKPIYNLKYWKWNTLFLALFGIAALVFLGENGFTYFIRFGLCLFGGVWASVVIFLQAKKRKLFLYGIAFFVCALSLTHFVRLAENVYNIWVQKQNVGLIFLLWGVLFAFGLLVMVNLYLNFNFALSGVKRRNNLRYAIILVLVCLTWFVTESMSVNEHANLEQHLLQRAQTTAAAVNPARIKDLTFSAKDETKKDFKRLKEQFLEVRKVNPDVRFIYLLGIKKGEVVFFLDAETKNSPDYAKPGDVWAEAPAVVKSAYLQGENYVAGPYTDKWGTWTSVFIPIKDFKTHKIVSVMGMDVGVKEWTLSIMQSRLFGIVVGMSVFICLLVFFVIYELSTITAAAIKKSEAKFSTAFERSPVLTAISTLEDGRFIDVNETFCHVLGYESKQDIIGKTSIELKMFRDSEERTQLTKNLKADGYIDNFEMQIQTKYGEPIIGLYYGSLIDVSGKKCLISVIEDITQRKKDQKALKEREKQQRLLTEVLHLLNIPSTSFSDTVRDVIAKIKQETGFDAVAVRSENTLAIHGQDGVVCRDKDGNVSWECMCGLVISGKTDPSNSLFTHGGSFWTNDSSQLLDLPASQDSIYEGYRSVAIIPIRADQKIVGALQLNDRRKGCFTLEMISTFESMCSSIGIGMKRKQVEEELMKSNLLLTTQQDVGIDGILSVDGAGAVISYNKRFVEMWGITPDVIDSGSDEILLKFVLGKLVDPQEFIEKVKKLYENKTEKCRDEVFLADGRIFDRYSSPMFSNDDKYYGRVWFFRDITDIKEAQKKLEESEQRFKDIAVSTSDMVWEFNAETIYTYCSENVRTTLGYSPAELEGTSFIKLIPEDRRESIAKALFERMNKREPLVDFEQVFIKKDGTQILGLVNGIPIVDSQGNLLGYRGVAKDITERKKLEAALQESQGALIRASKIKDEFLSITSHDLKSPLGIVKTSMSLLLDEESVTTTIKEYAELSLRQANKGLKLISDLLDLKKLETGDVRLEPTKFQFSKLVEEILHDFMKSYEQAGVSLQVDSEGEYEITADYNKVGQVISNLLGNALKYTSRGGSVKVKTSFVQKQDAGKITRDYLKVTVSDTGAGIPDDKIKKIFEKYEQANFADKKTGTGIGLSIAKYVCELHHGDIWVESKVGQGSDFIFILPYSKEVQEVYYNDSSALPYKILIVDDVDDQRFAARALLKKGNFSCDEASNWKEALDKIHNNTFSLVILDIEMPEINGYELLEIIRREKNSTELPVIMYSSKQENNDLCRKLGVSCFVKKEQAATDLVTQVRKTLGIV